MSSYGDIIGLLLVGRREKRPECENIAREFPEGWPRDACGIRAT